MLCLNFGNAEAAEWLQDRRAPHEKLCAGVTLARRGRSDTDLPCRPREEQTILAFAAGTPPSTLMRRPRKEARVAGIARLSERKVFPAGFSPDLARPG